MTGQETRVNSYIPGQISRARHNKSPDEYKFLKEGERNIGSHVSPNQVTAEDAPNLRS